MKKNILIAVAAFLFLIVFIKSSFIVNEMEQVVITQFGKPVGEAITEPGFYIKVPFIQTANFFERRYMEWDGDPNQVTTKDKKFIFVDTYARWQITDPLQFFKRLNNERGAQSRLDDILDGATRNFIASNNIEEAVRTSNREPVAIENTGEVIQDSLQTIQVGRAKIQDEILASANEKASDLGIEILDFRIKRINYVEEVQRQVFERMKSERFRIADKFRSEGQGEASRINGEKERELQVIQSEAFRTAQEIKGKADGEAAGIYARSYDKTPAARSLYGFVKSMESLDKTLNSESKLLLSTDSELYKYLKGY